MNREVFGTGWTVGQTWTGDAFLLEPNQVPVPGSLRLLGSGLMGLIPRRRKFRP